ncbi:MAG: AAA family ATPase [Barrevirus sp.]|uniref:AAA family ATPase n=1 Tax=Barrevirus sp. TaxID=2487763 RepID=A0A3G4ZSD8_9VIRU|nr:MAG: AAA family ATPase [Barrevirus sp.]
MNLHDHNLNENAPPTQSPMPRNTCCQVPIVGGGQQPYYYYSNQVPNHFFPPYFYNGIGGPQGVQQNQPIDINCSKCIELQQDVNHLTSQIKLMNKNIDLINEQVKLFDMKLSITNSLEKTPFRNNNNQGRKNNNRNNNNNNKQYKDYQFTDINSGLADGLSKTPKKNQGFTFVDYSDPFTTPKKKIEKDDKKNEDVHDKDNKNNKKTFEATSEPTFIIQFDEFGPPPATTNTKNASDAANPFGLLGSLLNMFTGVAGGGGAVKKGTGSTDPNTNIETSEEPEVSDHESDEEFEELELEINTLDDLIKLGHLYDETLEKEKKAKEELEKLEKQKEADLEKAKLEQLEKEKAEQTFVRNGQQAGNQVKFNFDKILMRDGTTKPLTKPVMGTRRAADKKAQSIKADAVQEAIKNNNKDEKIIKSVQVNPLDNLSIDNEAGPSVLPVIMEVPKVPEKTCVIDGKKYSINLQILNKLIKPLTKLKSMVGLVAVKNAVIDMILYYLQNFEKKNNNMLHTVIEGPPGVGKTQLGKIFAELYAALGVIPSSKFKIVKRSDLVGEYLGHTAPKTQKIIDEADGGVLFIDEAYSLGNEDKKDSFSKECIDTLNMNLSENKKKFICIIAGYPDELDRCFFSYNPGLARRFPFRFRIDGYSSDELKDIFVKKVNDAKWSINTGFTDTELTEFFKENKDAFPYYGGDVDNFIQVCRFAHSRRVFGKHPKNKRNFTKEDIEIGLERFKNNKKKEVGNDSYKTMFT